MKNRLAPFALFIAVLLAGCVSAGDGQGLGETDRQCMKAEGIPLLVGNRMAPRATDNSRFNSVYTTLVGGTYTASPSTLGSGDHETLRMHSNGDLMVRVNSSAASAVDTELPAATGSLRPTSLAETMTAVPTVTAVIVGADTGSNVFRPAHVDSAGDVQVDLASALPAGTALIGHVTAHAGEPFAVGVTNTVTVTVGSALPAGSNNIGDVDVLTVPAPLNVVGGGAEATALRVTVANDSTGVLSVDDNAGALTVDWAGTAPPIGAGLEATALRVTVATDSTGVLSVDDNSGSLTVDNAALAVVGGGAEATALRVSIANDSTGVLSVDDNGANLSVDWAGTVPPIGAGTEAAALRVTLATDSTGLVSVDDNAGSLTIDNAQLSVVGGGAEATAMRVTLANDSTGLLSIDDNGASLTVDAAGDVAHDSPDSGNPVKVGGRAVASAEGTAVAAANRTDLVADLQGRLFTNPAPATWTNVTVSAAANVSSTISQAAVAGRRHVVTSFSVYIYAAAAGADINVYVRDGATGAGTVKWREVIGSGAVRGSSVGFNFEHGIELSVNTAATIDVDAGGASVFTIANIAGYTE